jgi:hypothetical protein
MMAVNSVGLVAYFGEMLFIVNPLPAANYVAQHVSGIASPTAARWLSKKPTFGL